MLNNREKILFVGAVILISLFLIMPHTFAYMRTYNYTDIKNVSTTHKANYSVRGVGTFEFGTGPQASANNYTNVTASDNVKATATTSNEEPLNNESGHIFDFKLEEPKSGISSIRVVWEGATGADCSNLPGGSEALNAYFYNFSSNSWHKFAGACPLSGDVTLTGVLDTKQNISNFVSSNNFLRIGVNTSMDAAVGDTRTTYTDYVAINVTSNFRALNPPDIVAMNLTNSSITTNQQNTINVSVDIIRTGNATLNTYTYSGISTPSTTHKANYTYEAGGTFEFGTGPNATNNSYANVSFSDNLRAKVNANTTANDTGHVFDFNVTLSASKSAIKSIRVVWEGFGEYTACSIDVDNIQVSLYNFSSNTWSRIYQACPDPVDIEVVAILNTTQNISDFISSGGILRLAANSTVFVVSLQTDYVAANVTTLSGNWAVNTTLYNVTPGGPDIGQYTQNRAAAGYITNAAIPV
ncbi:TPA: hypothetical protein H1005_03840, partial [archaeon]|nr:hypothetical protein [Candidatus Naiadarchaeales archaeon SRR2090153.bin1042]